MDYLAAASDCGFQVHEELSLDAELSILQAYDKAVGRGSKQQRAKQATNTTTTTAASAAAADATTVVNEETRMFLPYLIPRLHDQAIIKQTSSD